MLFADTERGPNFMTPKNGFLRTFVEPSIPTSKVPLVIPSPIEDSRLKKFEYTVSFSDTLTSYAEPLNANFI